MIAYVQIYVHIRKNVQINISINNSRDFLLLRKAYEIALNWMNENNCQLTIIE